MSTSENKSEVPEIETIPKYEPCIPDHMLQNINDAGTKYIMEQLSIMQQNRAWQNKKIQEQKQKKGRSVKSVGGSGQRRVGKGRQTRKGREGAS